MRVLLGLAALAAGVSAQTVSVTNVGANINQNGVNAVVDGTGNGGTLGANFIAITSGAAYGAGTSAAATAAYVTFQGGNVQGVNGYQATLGPNDRVQSQTFTAGQVAAGVNTIYVQMNFNKLVAEVKYAYIQGYNQNILCDPCNSACTSNFNGVTDSTNTQGFCANLTGRLYTITPVPTGSSQFQVYFYNYVQGTTSNAITYSFAFQKAATVIVGDPQIVGMQGQDFQVHGMPDEIFNMVTYPNVQVNARFSYLSEAECPDNYTTCFAHPGTYISEQGIRVGKDKVRVVAGPAKAGLTVHVNGKKVHQKTTHLKLGSVEVVNHRRVVVKTPIAALTMTNSDKFMNQEISMFDEKLIALGANRHVLKAGQSFHPEVPLHGLQGQTWRNVEYPSGLEYEGSIMDYHVVDGNLFGSDFVFNKFAL